MSKLNKLRELIINNPELPIRFFVNEECHGGNFPYEECYISSVDIDYITLYGDKWMDEDDLYEKLDEDLYEEGMAEEEIDLKVKKVLSNTNFTKTICMCFS